MADNFGARKLGRVYEGGKFYSVPTVDVPANAIYFPRSTTSPGSSNWGVAEYPVKAGELGAFAKVGTFAFPKPDTWTSNDGRAVYYAPTNKTTGTFAAASASNNALIGKEVVVPGIPEDQIWVCIG